MNEDLQNDGQGSSAPTQGQAQPSAQGDSLQRLLQQISQTLQESKSLLAKQQNSTLQLAKELKSSVGDKLAKGMASVREGLGKMAQKAGLSNLQELAQGNANPLQDKLKGGVNQVGASIGGAIGGALGSVFGPLGAALGKSLGESVGKGLGGFLQRMFQRGPSAMEKFNQAVTAANKTVNDFRKELSLTEEQKKQNKINSLRYNVARQSELQNRLNALDSEEAAAISQVTGNNSNRSEERDDIRSDYQSRRNAIYNELAELAENSVELRKSVVEWTQQAKNASATILTNREQYSEQWVQEKETREDVLTSLSQTRTNFAAEREQYEADVVASATSKDNMAQMELLELDFQEKRKAFLEEEWRLQQKEINFAKAEIAEREKLAQEFGNLSESISKYKLDQTQKSWGLADWIGQYQDQASQLSAIDPASQQGLELQQKQWETLQKIESLQQDQVQQLEETARNTGKMLEDLSLSDLNPAQSWQQQQERYQSLKAQAATGDAKSMEEFSQYAKTYLEESRKQLRSSQAYQETYQSVREDLLSVQTTAQEQVQRLRQDFSVSGEMDALQSSVGQNSAAVNLSVQGLQTSLDEFVANLNQWQSDSNLELAMSESTEQMKDLNQSIQGLTASLNSNASGLSAQGTAAAGSSNGGFADGGIVSGPTSGYMATLHGTEAVIPLGKGALPLVLQGGASQPMAAEAIGPKLDQQNQLLGELIDLQRASAKSGSPVVVLDTQGIELRAAKYLTEGNRRGIHNLGN